MLTWSQYWPLIPTLWLISRRNVNVHGCSFLVTSMLISNVDYVNYYLKYRGPDHTTHIRYKNITFLHNLLHVTGHFTPQPYVNLDSEILSLFNGEIYNYLDFGKTFISDGYAIESAYHRYGDLFPKYLDGEFAIILVDMKKEKIIVASDVFLTKPLWYAMENGSFGISSYSSALSRLGFAETIEASANEVLIFDMNSYKIFNRFPKFTFELTQWKNSYDDWEKAFERAVQKRSVNLVQSCFIGLSSGYDSGAISLALSREGVHHHAFSIGNIENKDILEQRMKYSNFIIPHNLLFTESQFYASSNYLNEFAEPYVRHFKQLHCDILKDGASMGMSHIFQLARMYDDHIIYISGSGADETMTDYGFQGKSLSRHSQFGGVFPENLTDIFPWWNFYGQTQRCFLSKEEHIAGAHGVESRYPFLDPYLVQEYLWLKVELKNGIYKGALKNYMTKHNYPVEDDVKRGFHAHKNLKTTEELPDKMTIDNIMKKRYRKVFPDDLVSVSPFSVLFEDTSSFRRFSTLTTHSTHKTKWLTHPIMVLITLSLIILLKCWTGSS